MSTIGSLVVNVGARIAGFEKGLGRARSKLNNFAKNTIGSLKGLAFAGAAALGVGFGTGQLVSFVSESLNAIDSLGKMAHRLGLTTEEMAGFERAAKLSDTSVEQIEVSIAKMQKTLAEAAGGSKEAGAAFDRLGLDPIQLASLGTADAFSRITDAINTIPPGLFRTKAAMDIFGRSGGKLLSFLEGGSQGFRDMQAAAKKAGTSFTEKDFQMVQMANDSMTELKEVFTGIGRQLAIQLAPMIVVIAQELTKAAQAGGGLSNTMIDVGATGIAAMQNLLDMTQNLRRGYLQLKATLLDMGAAWNEFRGEDAMAARMTENAQRARAEIGRMDLQPSWGDQFINKIEEIRRRAQALANEWARTGRTPPPIMPGLPTQTKQMEFRAPQLALRGSREDFMARSEFEQQGQQKLSDQNARQQALALQKQQADYAKLSIQQFVIMSGLLRDLARQEGRDLLP